MCVCVLSWVRRAISRVGVSASICYFDMRKSESSWANGLCTPNRWSFDDMIEWTEGWEHVLYKYAFGWAFVFVLFLFTKHTRFFLVVRIVWLWTPKGCVISDVIRFYSSCKKARSETRLKILVVRAHTLLISSAAIEPKRHNDVSGMRGAICELERICYRYWAQNERMNASGVAGYEKCCQANSKFKITLISKTIVNNYID